MQGKNGQRKYGLWYTEVGSLIWRELKLPLFQWSFFIYKNQANLTMSKLLEKSINNYNILKIPYDNIIMMYLTVLFILYCACYNILVKLYIIWNFRKNAGSTHELCAE
jgi:hypothetical protein